MRWIKIATATTVALTLASAARAQAPAADPMAAFYGATLEIGNVEGWHAERLFAADHTFTQTGSDGHVAGTWGVEGGRVCTVQTSPPPAADRAKRYCNLGPGHKAGDEWEDRDPVTGNAVFFSLKPRG